MAAGLVMLVAFETAMVGAIILALCLIPISFIQTIGNGIVNALYKIRISNPLAANGSAFRGTVSLPLAVAGMGLVASAYNFLVWYRQFVHKLDSEDAVKRLETADATGKRYRLERDLYLTGCIAAAYLALHTVGRLNLAEQQQQSSAGPAGTIDAFARPADVAAAAAQPVREGRNTAPRPTAQAENDKDK